MKVCIVDSRVKESDIFLNSVQDDVTAILIDYETDTFESLLLKIGSAKSIAYVSHASFDRTYSFFKGSSFDMNVKEDWQPFFDFLKAINGLRYFDFLGCSLASDDRWKKLFLWTEETGISIRASTDDTGNLASGGNWILEDGPVDAKEMYFKEGIENYIGLLIDFNLMVTGTIPNVLTVPSNSTDWYTYSGTANTPVITSWLTYQTTSTFPAYTPGNGNTFITFDSFNISSGEKAYLISPSFTATNPYVTNPYVTFSFDFGHNSNDSIYSTYLDYI